MSLADRMRDKIPGGSGGSWSADDEDHAWRVGSTHAMLTGRPNNPPSEPQHRAAYEDGYQSTIDDGDAS